MCGCLRWSVYWVTGWVTGLWVGSLGWLPFTMWCLSLAAVSVVGVWQLYRRWHGFRPFVAAVAFLSAAAYMTWTDDHNRSVWPEHAREWKGSITGRLLEPPVVDGNRVDIMLRSEMWHQGDDTFSTGGEKVLVRLYLETLAERDYIYTFRRGDWVRVDVKLERPDVARNPGGFDYRQHLYRQHVHWIGRAQDAGAVERLTSSRHGLELLDRFRTYLGQRIDSVYEHPAAGLVRGMILGERETVDLQVERQFATLGLLHLLAISGLHVGIVLAIFYGGLKWMGVTRERAAAFALLFLPFYALLTGANPPVIRAAIVGGLVLLAVIYRRWKNSVHFLALAASLMLLFNPYWLFSASFQLSFTVTVGIVVGVPLLCKRMPKLPAFLRETVAVTVVAQLCSFPLIIYYFNQFSLLSGLANLIVVPFVSFIVIPLGFATVLLAGIAVPLATLPAKVNEWAVDVVLTVAEMLTDWEPFHLVWPTPPIPWVFVYYALLGAIGKFWLCSDVRVPRRRRVGLSLAFVFVVIFAHSPFPWWNRPLTVTFLDVGQGDAIVVETPQRQTIVVDAGGTGFFEREPWQVQRDPFDVGEDIVLPFLRHKGVARIDYLVMTHGDADHIGGMKALVENLPVRYFVRGADTHNPSELERGLLSSLEAADVPVYRVTSGSGWQLEDGLYWQFVQPEPEDVPSDERNAQSVVVLLSYQGRSFLLTGDADQEVEEHIVNTWDIPPVDVLKAGHHGSDTSTGDVLLQTVRPKVTVLSVGENNRYNHPHPDVIERLHQAGSSIFRTDRHGGITVRVHRDGHLSVEQSIVD